MKRTATTTSHQVYVSPDLLYFESGRVHLANSDEHVLDPADHALLELVYRGAGDFDLLCDHLAAMTEGPNTARVAETLRPRLEDPRSLLQLREAPAVATPDVILCDFGSESLAPDARPLLRKLRRRYRVLHLGLDDRVIGRGPDNVGFARTKASGHHQSWFEFTQWCRAIVARHDRAVLILNGQQDAILFGDLVIGRPSIVHASRSWPPPTGVGDVLGEGWIPSDPIDAVRALYYALLCSPEDDWYQLTRVNCSEFAMLEAFALRHASVRAVSAVDQYATLASLGAPREQSLLLHTQPSPPRRDGRDPNRPRPILLVADTKAHAEALLPFVRMLLSIPESDRAFDSIRVRSADEWIDIERRDDQIHMTASNRPAEPKSYLGAFAFPGLLRAPGTVFEVMSMGIPTFVVPSQHSNPWQSRLPPSLLLPPLTRASLTQTLQRLAAPGDPATRAVLRAQRAFLKQHAITPVVERLVEVGR